MAATAGRLNADAEQPAPRAPSVADLLRNSRFELLPLDGIEEQVLEHLATDTKVTVTASPRKGLEATLDLSERLSRPAIRSCRICRPGSSATARISRRSSPV